MNQMIEKESASETITEFYEQDHDRLDELFKSYQTLKNSNYLRAKESFIQFKFGLQRHILWEERVLFPYFEEKTGMTDSGPTKVMMNEHRQIGELLEAIHKKVQKSDPETGPEERMLIGLLGLHNLKEEKILYPAIDHMINVTERRTIFQKMQDISAESYEKCCSIL
jgi:iron-sulfur cluster repair protein YtfE (RIC family)